MILSENRRPSPIESRTSFFAIMRPAQQKPCPYKEQASTAVNTAVFAGMANIAGCIAGLPGRLVKIRAAENRAIGIS
jgi:hypothetical protein